MTRQVFGFCALATALATLGYAQQIKIATINIQGALVSTKDGQKAGADLESKAAPKRKAVETRQNEINSLKDQLQKGQNTLSEAAKNDLYRTIDQKTKALNRDMQDIQDELDQDQQKVLNELGQKIYTVIGKYAQEKGYTMVLDVSNPQTPIVWASNSIDITKDIIELYDKENGGAATTTTAAPAPSSKPPINTATPGVTRPVAPGTSARPAPATATPPKKP